MPVKIVTDSTASLPTAIASELGIKVVPLHVRFGTTDYREGIDLSTEEFYRLLESSPEHPATSQPNPSEFAQAYGELESNDDIASIHLSTELSKTAESASQAAREMTDRQVDVMDSRLVSAPLAFSVIAAARAAQQGATLSDIRNIVDDHATRAHVALVVPTLEYLRRGGRIGAAAAFLGSVLNFMPVLEIRDGQVGPVTRARSNNKAHAVIADYVQNRAPNGVESWAILHANAPDQRDRLRHELADTLDATGDMFADIPIGPVLGTHSGPGAFGFAFVARP